MGSGDAEGALRSWVPVRDPICTVNTDQNRWDRRQQHTLGLILALAACRQLFGSADRFFQLLVDGFDLGPRAHRLFVRTEPLALVLLARCDIHIFYHCAPRYAR